jgi:hypothetical protein
MLTVQKHSLKRIFKLTGQNTEDLNVMVKVHVYLNGCADVLIIPSYSKQGTFCTPRIFLFYNTETDKCLVVVIFVAESFKPLYLMAKILCNIS